MSLATVDSMVALLATQTLQGSAFVYFPALGTAALVTAFWPAILFAALWIVLFGIRTGVSNSTVIRYVGAAITLFCICIGAYAYVTLTSYKPFAGHVPFILALAGWSATLIALYLFAAHFSGRIQCTLAGCFTVLASVVLVVFNYREFRGLYPTLHEAVVLVAFASFILGIFVALKSIASRKPTVVAILAVVSIQLVILGAFSPESGLRRHRHFSEIGRAVGDDVSQQQVATKKIELDADAQERFARTTGFPILPETFAIDDYNVLLVTVEATRFDHTSLGGVYDVTPNISARAKHGFVATRAYAPSSGTLHSMSALFTMKIPSAVNLTTWMKPWHGKLSQSELTVAERFKQLGYATWWTGHSPSTFENTIVGFDQGFDEDKLYSRGAKYPNTDEKVVDFAIDQLTDFAAKPTERFFGWVFLSSPHGAYLSRGYEGMPNSTDHDRYLQSIRYSDEQFGRLFDSIESSGLLSKTVIVLLADHGEEFREHGGIRHKATVYTESIHVPLVFWIPGIAGRTDVPTSTVYALPYLLNTTRNVEVRDGIRSNLASHTGPLMRDTDGAVVAELIGHDRIKATVVSHEHKLNYDYRSQLFELFDLTSDPGEQHDVFDDENYSAAKKKMLGRFRSYDDIRSASFQHKFAPKKADPTFTKRIVQ